MDISTKVVLFRLSHAGRQALRGLVPGKGSFQALVVEMDSVGAWIMMSGKEAGKVSHRVPLMLLKWEYIATAAFEVEPAAPSVRKPIEGFQPRS